MPPILRHIYEHLRDLGCYDIDWLDRVLWYGFTVLALVLLFS